MKRVIKTYPIPLWLLLGLVIAAAVACAGWADEHKERGADQAEYERNYDRMARMAVGAQAAQAITMQGRAYEADKAGGLSADVIRLRSDLRSAWGKQGALTQQLNKARRELCQREQMLRDNGVRLYRRAECEDRP